ncbi:MAG: hypothetical protein ACXWDO_06320 [Bacteroidia bacterium]
MKKIFIILVFAGLVFLLVYVYLDLRVWKYPTKLSNKIDTVEVKYISWACACANWLPAKYINDPNYSKTDYSNDCIFIEAEKNAEKVPESYIIESGKKVRLIGSYYRDKGISRDYESPNDQRAEKAKVFKYSSFEIIK